MRVVRSGWKKLQSYVIVGEWQQGKGGFLMKKKILLVDCCVRGDQSRTLQLTKRWLDKWEPEGQVEHLKLYDLDLTPLPLAEVEERKDTTLAEQFAQADEIVVAAPYWDLSFPAALKVCLEWASCLGITFRYTEEGAQVGMSRARALVYVTTGGGPVRAQNLGYQYIQGWPAMMGVGETFCLAAENLDVWGTDVEAALARAEGEIPALVRRAAGI